MAQTSNDQRGIGESSHFWIRRLHSLTGIVPIGIFLCFHLTINSTVICGGDKFQSAVDRIHSLDEVGPLKLVEVVGIFVPIVFHAILGVQIWLSGRQNMLAYRYGGNIRYTLQRWTGLITIVFILYHLWHVHWLGSPFGGAKFDPHDAANSAALAIQANGWYAPAYAVGVLAAVYHFSNGIWTFLITWGVMIGRSAQRRVGYACIAMGIVLAAVGLSSLAVLRTTDTADVKTQPHEPSHVASITPDLAG